MSNAEDLGQNRTRTEEIELVREQIYGYMLRCLSERDIAKLTNLTRSAVHRHIVVIRKRNVAWFDKNKDVDARNRSFHKELADQLKEVVKETWILYNQALKQLQAGVLAGKTPNFAGCNALLHTILIALQQLRLHLRIIAPTPDQAYLTEQFKVLQEQQEKLDEKIQATKVHPL